MSTHLQRSLMLDIRRSLDGIGAPFLHSSAVDVFASMLFIPRRISLYAAGLLDLPVPQRPVDGWCEKCSDSRRMPSMR